MPKTVEEKARWATSLHNSPELGFDPAAGGTNADG